MSKVKTRQSLNRRITTILLALMLAMAVVLSIVSYMGIRNVYLRFYNEKAQQLVHILAQRTDWEKLDHYAQTGELDEYTEDLIGFYDSIKENFLAEGYLYIFMPGEHSFTYLFEARTENDDPSLIAKWGDVFEYTDFEYKYLVPDIQAGKAHDAIIFMGENEYGGGLETWSPVFDKDGNVRAMVEVDFRVPSFRRDLNSFVIRIVGAFILLVATVLFLMLKYLNHNVTKPITRLDESVNSYEHGELDLDMKLFRKDDEIRNLAESFSDMVQRIDQYTREVAAASAERERIGAELDVARQIQIDTLPSVFPAFPDRREFDIFASMETAKDIGGDFYDFFLVDDDHLAMLMGDVSGKGIPSALFMVMVRTLIKNRALQGFTPSEVLQTVSEQMYEGTKTDMFATAWLAVLELSTGKGVAANAGHEHPVLRHEGGRFELQIYRHSAPVAAMDTVRFRDHGFKLLPGDTLFIYTDGVTNLVNEKNETFGASRVVDALNTEPDSTPAGLVQIVKDAGRKYAGGSWGRDDLSLLALKYYGPDAARGKPEIAAPDGAL